MKPPSWTEVPAAMREWIRDVSKVTGADQPIEALAESHAGFERIHPFLDGNGRTGRLLLNLLLLRLGYAPAIIYLRDRSRYLRALRAADTGEPGPLGELVARAVLDNLYRFVVPAVAGPRRLVPLTALASKDLSEGALRVAANRGRLRAQKDHDGHWRSTRRGSTTTSHGATNANRELRSRRGGSRGVRCESELGGAVITAGDLKLDALPLLGALMEPEVDDVVFVEAAVAAVEQRVNSQISPVVTPDDRGLQWMRMIDELAELYAPRPYIGIFRRVVRAAASNAANLSPEDGRVAAMVIIDQTTATAESLSDFRDGVLAAQSISPNVLHPRLVVRRLLRTALPYVDDPKARINVVYALRLTLEILSQATEQSLSLDDLEILSTAIDEMPVLRDELRALGEKLHKKDRKPFLSLLPPVEGGRRHLRRH